LNADPRRFIALILAVVLIVGVVIAVGSQVVGRLAPTATPVAGLIGSEKLPFFQDQHVIDAMKQGGFVASVQTAGSRQIANADLSAKDFAFPAGVPAAEKIRRDHSGTTSVVPFYTPMAIATWQPIVDLLTQAGVIKQRTGYLAFDVAAFMDLASKDTRWHDLANNTTYDVNKSILLTTTDVRRSNSAAMYLAIISYVANGNNIVELGPNVNQLTDQLSPLFLRQGFSESSSEEPFNDYLVQGIGKSPLVMIYEAQYLARAAANDGSITPQMVLVYPEPTIFSKHTLVGLTPAGQAFGNFMNTDPTIRQLATTYGFRTSDTQAFRQFVTDHQLNVPDSIIDVIEPPTYESLEAMITRLESIYAGELGASPVPTDDSSASP
jgi:hypothetical protein